jgi:hypothetical protein
MPLRRLRRLPGFWRLPLRRRMRMPMRRRMRMPRLRLRRHHYRLRRLRRLRLQLLPVVGILPALLG